MATTQSKRPPVVRADGYAAIGEYAAIGDGRTIALVARDGSIDWLPLPTIRGETVFGALLDAEHGGRFRLAPDVEFEADRRYVEHTNVLETTFVTATGTVRVTDALTLTTRGLLPWVELVRRVECLDGRVRVRWQVEPRFGYGLEKTTVIELGGVPVARGGDSFLAVLAFDLGTPQRSAATVAGAVELAEGEGGLVACVATEGEPMPLPTRAELERHLEETEATWRGWVQEHPYEGPWAAAVERSALALELLTYAPTGTIAGAGTTGLPEKIGGKRNYDYRLAWVRDSAFALDALSSLDRREDVHESLSFLLDATRRTHPRLQPIFGFDGSVPRGQQELPLDGYRGSRPVKLGNSASSQLQLGNYGDFFGAVWHYVEHGNVLDPATGVRLAEVADLVCRIWQNEDSGLWELGQKRQYTISKMSCWLALTRAAELAERGQVPRQHAGVWRETADQVREFVETRCWSEAKRSYSFHAGSDTLDCAVLLGAGFGYADPAGERMEGTIAAIRGELSAGGPLLYRYSGMEGEEGAFLACSFWLVTALAGAGRLEEARHTMDELIEAGNDVGLYSEEIDPASRELLGNFPQTLTHLSLILAAAATGKAARTGDGERSDAR